jgi:hypothetical protein
MAKFDGQKVIEHLKAKWAGRPCPLCLVGNWNVHDSTFQLTEFNEGSMVIGGPVIPVIPVICNNCGNTVLVNAITAGLIKPEAGGKP